MVVESDKADMDVEAFESGYLAKILVPEGSSAPVGSAVALLVEDKAHISSVATAAGPPRLALPPHSHAALYFLYHLSPPYAPSSLPHSCPEPITSCLCTPASLRSALCWLTLPPLFSLE